LDFHRSVCGLRTPVLRFGSTPHTHARYAPAVYLLLRVYGRRSARLPVLAFTPGCTVAVHTRGCATTHAPAVCVAHLAILPDYARRGLRLVGYGLTRFTHALLPDTFAALPLPTWLLPFLLRACGYTLDAQFNVTRLHTVCRAHTFCAFAFAVTLVASSPVPYPGSRYLPGWFAVTARVARRTFIPRTSPYRLVHVRFAPLATAHTLRYTVWFRTARLRLLDACPRCRLPRATYGLPAVYAVTPGTRLPPHTAIRYWTTRATYAGFTGRCRFAFTLPVVPPRILRLDTCTAVTLRFLLPVCCLTADCCWFSCARLFAVCRFCVPGSTGVRSSDLHRMTHVTAGYRSAGHVPAVLRTRFTLVGCIR